MKMIFKVNNWEPGEVVKETHFERDAPQESLIANFKKFCDQYAIENPGEKLVTVTMEIPPLKIVAYKVAGKIDRDSPPEAAQREG
jgi:hypothetical protein